MYKIIKILPLGLLSAFGTLLLFYLSLTADPLQVNEMRLFPGVDKIAHFLMYFTLTLGYSLDLTKLRFPHRIKINQELALCAFAFVLSVVLEVLQGVMGQGRSMDINDALFNLLGVVGAFFAMSFYFKHYFWKALKKP